MTGSEVETQPPSAARGPGVAIYDMDGVITTGDTFVRYLRTRVTRLRSKALAAFVRSLRADRRSDVSLGRRFMLVRGAVLATLAGTSESSYRAEVARLASEWAHEPGWIHQAVVRDMRELRAAAVPIIVATACERRLAEALLEAAEAPYDLLSASVVDRRGADGEWTIQDYRIGQFKADALARIGVDLSRAVFTTDSLVDLPTALRCEHTRLVCSSTSRLPERFRDHGVSVTRWDPNGPPPDRHDLTRMK